MSISSFNRPGRTLYEKNKERDILKNGAVLMLGVMSSTQAYFSYPENEPLYGILFADYNTSGGYVATFAKEGTSIIKNTNINNMGINGIKYSVSYSDGKFYINADSKGHAVVLWFLKGSPSLASGKSGFREYYT